MTIRFAATMNAVNRGLAAYDPVQAVHLIEDWETALSEVYSNGAKGILRDLASLRKQIESGNPDEERVYALLHRLGDATLKVRPDKDGERVRMLGQGLLEAGVATGDEPMDEEAAAAPKRARGAI